MKKIVVLKINNIIEVNHNVIWTSGTIHTYLRNNVLLDISRDNVKKYVWNVYDYILVTYFSFLCLLYSEFESFKSASFLSNDCRVVLKAYIQNVLLEFN